MSGNNQNDDDLKRRLRKHNDERLYLEADELMCEAADRIEQLEKERNKYRKQVQLGFKHLVETPVLTDEEIEDGYTAFEHIRKALCKALAERDAMLSDIKRCYKMLLSEPDTKGALFKAENILREAIAEAKGD